MGISSFGKRKIQRKSVKSCIYIRKKHAVNILVELRCMPIKSVRWIWLCTSQQTKQKEVNEICSFSAEIGLAVMLNMIYGIIKNSQNDITLFRFNDFRPSVKRAHIVVVHWSYCIFYIRITLLLRLFLFLVHLWMHWKEKQSTENFSLWNRVLI